MTQSSYKAEGVNRIKNMRFYSFVFTGKELDEETGYGYFGARYMDHELMTGWLSVDPMSDKYPSISPYAYCAWNPMKLVDPNGMIIDSASVSRKIWKMVDPSHRKYNDDFAKVFNQLAADNTTIFTFNEWDDAEYDEVSGTVVYGRTDLTKHSKDGLDVITIGYTWGKEGNLKWKSRVMCEEVYHGKQFLDGDFAYGLSDGKWQAQGLGLDDEKAAHFWSAKVCKIKPEKVWGDNEIQYYTNTLPNATESMSAEDWYINRGYLGRGAPTYINGVYKDDYVNMRKPKKK